MRRNHALLLLLGLCLSGSALANSFAQDIPSGLTSAALTSSQLSITSPSPDFTAIRLSAPGVRIEDRTLDFETYQELTIPGEATLYREGCPSIPQITRYYRIPNTGSVELEIGEVSYTLVDDLNMLPVQPEDQRFSRALVKSAEVYGVDAWYPETIAEVGVPVIMRDFRVVPVTLYPVQVNTVTGQARIYDQLDVDLVANDQPGENEKLTVKPVSGNYVPLYRGLIANLDENALDDAAYDPGDYVILCQNDTAVLRWADTLATWKQRRGFHVHIEARNNWSHISMFTYLRDLYEAPDSRLEFVCIIGDASFGSTYYMPTSTTQWDGEYDHYFSLVDGDDDLADIAVGRLSVQSTSDLATVMNKILLYERTPYMTDTRWFNRAFLYSSSGQQISSNEILMFWAKRQFEGLTGVDSVTTATHSGNVSNTVIGNELSNPGAAFFFWRGSVIGEMDNSAASARDASPELPVVLTITCGTGSFDEGTSITESWLRAGTSAQPRGGVCCVGTATTYTHVAQNNTFAGGLVYNICNLGIEHVGNAIVGAKYELFRTFLSSTDAIHFARWNNLMGDPSISMWTDTPEVMNCSFPGTVNVGARRVTVQALYQNGGDPIEDALVVLWKKDDDSYTKGFTDAGGFVELPVAVNSTGEMLVTVTKRNHKPYLGTIACVNAAAMTTYYSHQVDDDNAGNSSGNGDGNVNPGEIIELPVTLKNHGSTDTAENVVATLQSDNPKVVILNGSVNYPNIAPNQTRPGTSDFRIQVNSSMRHEETAKLRLTVATSQGTQYSVFELECQAGSAYSETISVTGGDGDSRLEPGEVVDLRVTVRNTGGVEMNEVTGELVSQYSLFSVLESSADFGDIAIGGTSTNTNSAFSVRANAGTYPGSLARAVLVLTYGSGSVDSVALTIPIGVAATSDPTGPDAYGYYAYDNIDVDNQGNAFPWLYEDSWQNISTIGTELAAASNDPGEQTPNGQTNSDLVALPFEFTFYGQPYDQITVCSNGWAAFGDQDELDMFRNYPIPAMQAPDAMLAPFWDDLRTEGGTRGVWYYHNQAESKFIIQWRTTGFAFGEINSTQEFQVILLDPSAYPTDDGNGVVVFHYNACTILAGDANDVAYETIGIQAPGGLVGLPYRFRNQGSPGAWSSFNSHIITITTQANVATGSLLGNVLDAESEQPLPDVSIYVDGEGLVATTDENGDYVVDHIVTGTYTLRAVLAGYNDGVIEEFVVEQDSTEVGNFSMLHPEIELSTSDITVVLPDDAPEASFSLINNGNGPLNYEIDAVFSINGEQTETWGTVADFDASATTGNFQLQGCEFMGDYWFVSGTVVDGDHKIYRFNLDGSLDGSFVQPPSTSNDLGWEDIVNADGVIYGSGGMDIIGVNHYGDIVSTITGVPQVNPKTALAWDPATDHFWIADYSTDIFEMDRDGNTVNRFDVPGNGINIKGLAWNADDPDGYKLYIFHLTDFSHGLNVSRMHPGSGDIDYLLELPSAEGERAGGCAITSNWNSVLQVFAGIVQGPTGDRLVVRQLNVRDDWYSISPRIASVAAGGTRDISLFFDAAGLRDSDYDLTLNIVNNSADNLVTLPVRLTSFLDTPEHPIEVTPAEYSLSQNYPNPFNSSTTFEYSLRQAGPTTLRIYNLLGQQVATLVDGVQEAGLHTVNFDLNLTASGVYIYRLESGSFSASRKLVFLK